MSRNRKLWTLEEMEVLKAKYPDTVTSELATMFNCTERVVYYKAHEMGLKKTDDYLKTHGGWLTGDEGKSRRYPKGHQPFNKGKKQVDYMEPETIEKIKATQFKKGMTPANAYAEDGVITQRVDKKGNPYLMIRVALGKWVYLTHHNWEKENGPVPKGMCVALIDGNPLNCEPENLKLITRKENMLRNSITNLPPEIRANITVINKLNKTIKKLEKEYGTE
jgi:hypothetical protein